MWYCGYKFVGIKYCGLTCDEELIESFFTISFSEALELNPFVPLPDCVAVIGGADEGDWDAIEEEMDPQKYPMRKSDFIENKFIFRKIIGI